MPARATEDQWELAACPHHGPGLANASGGGFHSVWFGLRGGKAAVHYGLLDAAGKPAGPVRDLPDERAEHADLAANDNGVAVMASRSMDWWGSSEAKLHVMPRGVRTSGASFAGKRVVAGNPAKIVQMNNESWPEVRKIEVRRSYALFVNGAEDSDFVEII